MIDGEHMLLILRLLTIFVMLIPAAHADDMPNNALQCRQIIVAGDSQWAPYVIQDPKTQKLNGIGFDLVKDIFAELDLPVVAVTYDDLATMMQGLRDGEIDMLVSTYDNSALGEDAQLIKPAYNIDPVTVAVNVQGSGQISGWDSLLGIPGLKDANFYAEDTINDYLNSVLQVTNQDLLITALQSVRTGLNKYVVGSELQLTYAVRKNGLDEDLTILKNLNQGGDVHMAFGNNSACKEYAIYVQKRLQDYKNNGTVDRIIKRYIR